MPIYEYKCSACGHVFEEWGRISDDSERRSCPRCAAEAPRILSNTAFVLKGGGWYVTDYGYRKNAAGDETSPSSDASGDAAPATPATSPEPASGSGGASAASAASAASGASAASAPAAASAASGASGASAPTGASVSGSAA